MSAQMSSTTNTTKQNNFLIFLAAVYLNEIEYVKSHKSALAGFKHDVVSRWLYQICVDRYYMDLAHELLRRNLLLLDEYEIFAEAKGPNRDMLRLILGMTLKPMKVSQHVAA